MKKHIFWWSVKLDLMCIWLFPGTKKVPDDFTYKQQSICYLFNLHIWRLVGSYVEAVLMFRHRPNGYAQGEEKSDCFVAKHR